MKKHFKSLLVLAMGLVCAFACVATACNNNKKPDNTPSTVEVTSVELSKTSVTLKVDGEEQITATVNPDNATNKTVTWSSSAEAIATVDTTGKIKAIAVGTATVTAKAGNKTANCTVKVEAKEQTPPADVAVTGVTLDKSTATITAGQTEQLTATVAPDNATNKAVTWSSNAEAIATVSATGLVTAVSAGEATITVTSVADNTKKATCVVTVTSAIVTPDPVALESIALSETTATVDAGNDLTLTVSYTPANATNKAITWSTSDESVATVVNGVVTAVAEGTATITATSDEDNSITATCAITVVAATPVTGVTLDKATAEVEVGATVTLTATVAPENASNKQIEWTSSDESKATVANGVVTGVAAGTVTITATSVADNTKKAECEVTVSAAKSVYEKLLESENKIYAEDFSETATLPAFDSWGVRGIYGVNSSVVAGAAKQDGGKQCNIYLDFGINAGVIECYFEMTLTGANNSWTPVQIYGVDTGKPNGSEIFGLRGDGGNFKYRIDGGNTYTDGTNPVTVANATYKVYMKVDLTAGTITMTVDGKAYVTDLAIPGLSAVYGINFASSSDGNKAVSIDNVVVTMNATAEQYKTVALAKLEALKASYDLVCTGTENGAEIAAANTKAQNAINAEGATVADMYTAYATAVSEMSAVDTDTVVALKTAKTTAIAELEGYKGGATNFTKEANKTAYETAIADGINGNTTKEIVGINNATTTEEVAAELAKAKAAIDQIKTDSQLETNANTVVFANSTTPNGTAFENGESVAKPEDPTAPNSKFVGWYTDEACTTEATFPIAYNGTPNATITVYAKWNGILKVGTDVNLINIDADVEDPSGVVTFVKKSAGTESLSTPMADPNNADIKYSSAYKLGGGTDSSRNIKIVLTETCTVYYVMRTGKNGEKRCGFIANKISKTTSDAVTGSLTENTDSSALSSASVELAAGTWYLNADNNIQIFAIVITGKANATHEVSEIGGTITQNSEGKLDLSALTFTVVKEDNTTETIAYNATCNATISAVVDGKVTVSIGKLTKVFTVATTPAE